MFDAAQNFFYRFLVSSTALKIKKGRLTYLSFKKLFFLEKTVRAAVKVPGEFLEAGVALGGTSVLIASHLPSGRTFTGYDVFGMIPTPTSDKDDQKSKDRYETIKSGQSVGIVGEVYYGYLPNLLERVKSTFREFDLDPESPNLRLVKGWFDETLQLLPSDRVAFAHIDCDWYDPVRLCLDRIAPAMSAGGYIVLDDYWDYGGCKTAVDEFLKDRADFDVVRSHPSFVLVKRPKKGVE